MPPALAAIVVLCSGLGFAAVTVCDRRQASDCAMRVLLLLALISVAVVAPRPATQAILMAAASLMLALYVAEEQATVAAAIAAWLVVMIAVLRFPASWIVSMAFLLGWAQYAGVVAAARAGEAGNRRDATDLVPAVVAVLVSAVLIEEAPQAAAIVLLATTSVIVNDVISGDVGPQFGGRAVLIPALTPVRHGTPGAVSLAGVVAGGAASGCAGLCASVLTGNGVLGECIAAAGLAGGLIDSVLRRTSFAGGIARGREVINGTACVGGIGLAALANWLLENA